MAAAVIAVLVEEIAFLNAIEKVLNKTSRLRPRRQKISDTYV